VKFLLDVCASSRSLRTILASLGHDVLLAIDVNPRAPDELLLDLAMQEGRVLITKDKDCGELAFVHRLPHLSIVRFVEMRVDDQVAAMQELLDHYLAEMQRGALIVVTRVAYAYGIEITQETKRRTPIEPWCRVATPRKEVREGRSTPMSSPLPWGMWCRHGARGLPRSG
jgi:predicted nuclease of predicted toxin-antitoxin system